MVQSTSSWCMSSNSIAQPSVCLDFVEGQPVLHLGTEFIEAEICIVVEVVNDVWIKPSIS